MSRNGVWEWSYILLSLAGYCDIQHVHEIVVWVDLMGRQIIGLSCSGILHTTLTQLLIFTRVNWRRLLDQNYYLPLFLFSCNLSPRKLHPAIQEIKRSLLRSIQKRLYLLIFWDHLPAGGWKSPTSWIFDLSLPFPLLRLCSLIMLGPTK